MQELSELVNRKFTDIVALADIEIETDTGWQPITAIAKTIPYRGFEVVTSTHKVKCADTHILFRADLTQVFAQDLVPGDLVMTNAGPEEVLEVIDLQEEVPMLS